VSELSSIELGLILSIGVVWRTWFAVSRNHCALERFVSASEVLRNVNRQRNILNFPPVSSFISQDFRNQRTPVMINATFSFFATDKAG
jgi:hypothetical protein